MNESKIGNFILEWFTSFVLFFFIVSFAVTFTLHFRPLYYADIDFLKIEQRSGMVREEICANYDVLIDYNSIFSEIKTLQFPTLSMSETGKIHFEEVKVIFKGFQWMAVVCFVVGSILIFLNQKKGNCLFWKYTSILTVVVPTLLAGLIAMNWEWVFVMFHKIAFNNDYWIFDASTDPVIMILPDAFFLHCAVLILFCVVLGSGICLLVYKSLKRRRIRYKK